MSKERVRVFISGIVQGVGFRFYTIRRAQSLGVFGFVKNLRDGRVEVVTEGDSKTLEMFVNDLRKGPPVARVTNIEVIREKYKGEFKSFELKWF